MIHSDRYTILKYSGYALLMLGLFGPIPVALIFYWFCNGLWTLGQTVVINTLVARKWPQSEEHHALREADRAAFYTARTEAKGEEKWVKQRRREARRAAPEEAAEIRAEIDEFLQRQKDAAAEEKKARRERMSAQTKARNARRRQRNEEKKKARQPEEADGQDAGDGDGKGQIE